ncbi:MAG: DegT/DnrJ/EryC1/StrS family aminotransferase [Actinomycetota bacterium]|nr:DegT/DnrJ/EryC1/StrS family aminotransferase [Actinomycetota bacterium]
MSGELNLGNVPFVDFEVVHRPVLEDLRAAFERVLARGCFNGGAEVDAFEQALANRVGAASAVGVGSGTAALQLALQAAGIGAGDEVIVPSNSFFATAGAVLAVNATPVFADVDAATALLDPDAVEAAVTSRTAAVIAVHLYGQPADVDRLRAVADRHRLFLLEDAAQAIGGSWDGRPVGSLGHAAAFSFYATKNLGALGEAGAVTTSDPELARRVTMLRSHGEAGKHLHELAGTNERLDALQAAFLAVKLAQFDEAQRLRDAAVARYHDQLTDVEELALFQTLPQARNVHHLMVVQVPRRDHVLDCLRAAGIGAAVHYPTPIHLQPLFRDRGWQPGQLPVTERLAGRILSLPLFAGMSDDQVDRSAHALSVALKETR